MTDYNYAPEIEAHLEDQFLGSWNIEEDIEVEQGSYYCPSSTKYSNPVLCEGESTFTLTWEEIVGDYDTHDILGLQAIIAASIAEAEMMFDFPTLESESGTFSCECESNLAFTIEAIENGFRVTATITVEAGEVG